MSKTHKCRVPGPCWGCRHTIERGETYHALVVWGQHGPRRTKRVHAECYFVICGMTHDEFNDWEPGTICQMTNCSRCAADRIQAAAGTPIDAKGGTL